MTKWVGWGFQNGGSYLMVLVDYLHDLTLLFLVLILSMVLVVLVGVILNGFIFLNKLELQSLEFLWTVLPCFLLLGLGVPSLSTLYSMEGSTGLVGLTIKVNGHQWYWEYDYSDLGGVEFDSYMIPSEELVNGMFRFLEVDNRVVVPCSVVVRFVVGSADVLHSWALPSLGVKVDANPGRLNMVMFGVLGCSVHYGQCSEICGANHSFMPIVVESTLLSKFMVWSGVEH